MAPNRTFTIRGARNGSQVFLTWSDGALSGDPPTVDLVQIEAELAVLHPQDRQSWSKVGGYGSLPENPLLDPDAAWLLIVSVLDVVSHGEGNLPPAAVDLFRAKRR